MDRLQLPQQPTLLLELGFVGLSVVMTAFAGWWSQRPVVWWLWLLGTGLLAWFGVFEWLTLPPPLILALVLGLMAAIRWQRAGGWRVLPLPLLVGFQSFRIVIELLIHQAVREQVAPPQFTWTGLNFDIAVGISALVLFPFARKIPRRLLMLWNFLGVCILSTVVIVAILSLPLPFQMFPVANHWIGFFPFPWLPLVLVLIAMLGHIALFFELAHAPSES